MFCGVHVELLPLKAAATTPTPVEVVLAFSVNRNIRHALRFHSSFSDLGQVSRSCQRQKDESESCVLLTSSYPIEFKLCMHVTFVLVDMIVKLML